jgi:hypothetical protein
MLILLLKSINSRLLFNNSFLESSIYFARIAFNLFILKRFPGKVIISKKKKSRMLVIKKYVKPILGNTAIRINLHFGNWFIKIVIINLVASATSSGELDLAFLVVLFII